MSYRSYPVVDFKKNVAKWIVDCIADTGVPMFRTTIVDGKPTLMGVCWGGHNYVGSVKFENVPEEDLELAESTTGEWRIFLKKYGDENIKKMFKAALIYEDGEKKKIITFGEKDPWDLL